jgi:hypothetical protein
MLAVFAAAAVMASEAQASVFGDSARGVGKAGPCITFPGPDTCALGARQFAFIALGFPGGAVGGYTQVKDTGSRQTGIIRCMEVAGNQAVIGRTAIGTAGIENGTKWSIWVIDNGPAGSTPPDLISPLFFYDDATADPCATTFAPPFALGYMPVTAGDIVVRDGTL